MREPQIVLQKIHRQAEDSPIISLANAVRNGTPLLPLEKPNLTVRRTAGITMRELVDFDQVICATNAKRTDLNGKFRDVQARPRNAIVAGDKLICLRNNMSYGVFNGMLLFVDSILDDQPLFWRCDLRDETGKLFPKLPVWKEPFQKDIGKDFTIPKTGYKDPPMVYCDFGYVITCHKAQGSEWDKVLVFDQYMPPKIWDMKRWRYTAITRAAKELNYCL